MSKRIFNDTRTAVSDPDWEAKLAGTYVRPALVRVEVENALDELSGTFEQPVGPDVQYTDEFGTSTARSIRF